MVSLSVAGGTRACSDLFLYPIQYLADERVIEFLIYLEEVVHALDDVVPRCSGVNTIDSFGNGIAIRAAHDGVFGPMDDQHRRVHILPDLAKIKGLELLIEGSGTSILPVRRVVPEIFPFRMFCNHLSR